MPVRGNFKSVGKRAIQSIQENNKSVPRDSQGGQEGTGGDEWGTTTNNNDDKELFDEVAIHPGPSLEKIMNTYGVGKGCHEWRREGFEKLRPDAPRGAFAPPLPSTALAGHCTLRGQ